MPLADWIKKLVPFEQPFQPSFEWSLSSADIDAIRRHVMWLKIESPCEITGKPCRWISEEQYDDNGELENWDSFCADCYRYRDWAKDECDVEL
jgi:hypothetical protein